MPNSHATSPDSQMPHSPTSSFFITILHHHSSSLRPTRAVLCSIIEQTEILVSYYWQPLSFSSLVTHAPGIDQPEGGSRLKSVVDAAEAPHEIWQGPLGANLTFSNLQLGCPAVNVLLQNKISWDFTNDGRLRAAHEAEGCREWDKMSRHACSFTGGRSTSSPACPPLQTQDVLAF